MKNKQRTIFKVNEEGKIDWNYETMFHFKETFGIEPEIYIDILRDDILNGGKKYERFKK